MTDAGDLSAVPPPTQPGWYADAHGTWWWWDGASWTPAAAPVAPAPSRSPERTTALVMWIVFLVGGGWIAALIFYLVSKDKPFVRHHSAEALNLTLLLLIPQLLAFALLVPGYITYLGDVIDAEPGASVSFDPGSTFWVGLVLILLTTLASYAAAIAGAIQANRGRWWRMPLPFHPVRGVVREGEEPYSVE
ncbi:MAG: DUF4870 domain-containing protein [Iamia sp.]